MTKLECRSNDRIRLRRPAFAQGYGLSRGYGVTGVEGMTK